MPYIKGLSPDHLEHYWNGTGWGEYPHSFSKSDAEKIERDINRHGTWCAWQEDKNGKTN